MRPRSPRDEQGDDLTAQQGLRKESTAGTGARPPIDFAAPSERDRSEAEGVERSGPKPRQAARLPIDPVRGCQTQRTKP